MNKNNKLKKKSKISTNIKENRNVKKSVVLKRKLKKKQIPLKVENIVNAEYNGMESNLKQLTEEGTYLSKCLRNGTNKKKKHNFVNCIDMKNNVNYAQDIFDEEMSSSSSYEDDGDLLSAIENSKKLNLKKCRIYEPNFSIKWKDGTSDNENTKKKVKKSKQVEKLSTKKKKNSNKNMRDEIESDLDDDDMETNDKMTESERTLDMDCSINSNIQTKSKYSNDVDINNVQNINSAQFYITSSCCIFVLKHPCKLYFYGKFLLTVISGAVEIFGHKLDSHVVKKEIYSPRGTGLLFFETVDTKRNKNLNIKLKKLNLSDEIIEQIVTSNEDICVLALQKLENKLTKSLENYFTHSFFPKIYQNKEGRYFSQAELVLQTYFEEDPSNWSVFEIDHNWKSVVDKVEENSTKTRLMACGGKGVGKSTFLKYTVNKLLNNCKKVLFIDLDPGQPEFAIPGTLSASIVDSAFFGPNYTHTRKSIKCNFIGEVNITHCFVNYLEAVKDLMVYCEENFNNDIPWIINYMGYSKSLGNDLILSVIKYVNPTILVQLQSNHNKRNFLNVLESSYVNKEIKNNFPCDSISEQINYTLFSLQSKVTNKQTSKIEAKLLREAAIISYFSEILISNNNNKPLQTYCVPLASVKLSHINGNDENLLAVLNGNLVALCSNSTNKCVGFGIIRGIDTSANTLYVITPETRDTMKDVNNLVMGFITMPISFYLNIESTNITPYVCVRVKENTASIPKRSYLSYQQLLKKHN